MEDDSGNAGDYEAVKYSSLLSSASEQALGVVPLKKISVCGREDSDGSRQLAKDLIYNRNVRARQPGNDCYEAPLLDGREG